MPNTLFPTQIGYRPTGNAGVPQVSTLYFGRIVSGVAPLPKPPDGPGFGAGGRPDYLQTLMINLSRGPNAGQQWATITLNVEDLVTLAGSNEDFPDYINMTLKEVFVCEDGVKKGMLVIASQTYTVSEEE